ncbi:ABC transporter permease subunit [filamentous cyanobacterium LEGE 11480]|uniref:ABC transporter permease subunit n=1 Tax=Romeriopsis navalis LEGE 11480 TaxID=2777977 RepID=A0A928VNS1_9CYAN|nr:ABC transporter permease subunit [Romeriopsis navalis]MBE9031058.1 ABC transporter permease subunit [Romeriopsis navalis LEGE 11480]
MTKAAQIHQPKRWSPVLYWLLSGGLIFGLALIPSGIGQREIFNWNGWPQFWRFVVAAAQPNLTPDLLSVTLDATVVTLAYAICGTFLSILLGSVFGLLSSQVWWESLLGAQGRWVYQPVRLLLAVPRAIHELIWGLLLLNIWGLDPLSAIVAIAIPFGAITAKVFSEILDDTPRQPLQALLNSGTAPLIALVYGLLPQAFLNLFSYGFYRFECSLRSAAVLGVIGAGGLGYQILVSLQSLKYDELWTFFYALMILNGGVDWCSAQLRDRFGCVSRLDLNVRGRSPKPGKLGAVLANKSLAQPTGFWIGVLIAVGSAIAYLKPDFERIGSVRSQRLAHELFTSLWPLDWSGVGDLGLPMLETVAMSIVAILVAAVFGLLLAFPAARHLFQPGGLLNSGNQRFWPTINRLGARVILLVSRAIPAPIWALVMLYVMFPGILPGAIALGIHNLGILGRLMAEVIENLDQRPLEALKTTGASNGGIFLYGILPLTMPRFLAYSLYRWEVCMRETVIVGLVGVGGLGRILTEQLTSFDYAALVVTLMGFLVLTFGVDWVSGQLRKSVR